MIKIGINGFGRIGRLVFRAAICADDIEVVAVNAPDKTPEQLAYTVKYDSVHGRFHGTVDCEGGENPALIVNGKRVALLNNRDAKLLPWGELGVEYVLECTGAFLTKEKAQDHLDAGAQVVVLSGPSKDDTPMFVCGVNLDAYTPDIKIVSNASCTTNCLAPLAKIINDNFGIARGPYDHRPCRHGHPAGCRRLLQEELASVPRCARQHHPDQHRRCQGGRQGHSGPAGQADRHFHAHPERGRVHRRSDLPPREGCDV